MLASVVVAVVTVVSGLTLQGFVKDKRQDRKRVQNWPLLHHSPCRFLAGLPVCQSSQQLRKVIVALRISGLNLHSFSDHIHGNVNDTSNRFGQHARRNVDGKPILSNAFWTRCSSCCGCCWYDGFAQWILDVMSLLQRYNTVLGIPHTKMASNPRYQLLQPSARAMFRKTPNVSEDLP